MQPFCAHYPSKILRAGEEAEWAKASICLMSPTIWVWVPGPTTEGENGPQHCPWCQRYTGCAPQPAAGAQWPCGERTAARPLLSERRQAQLAASLICTLTLSVVSLALQPPAGSGAFLALLRVMGGINATLRGSPFLVIFPSVLVGMTWCCITNSSLMLTVPCAGNSICGRP